jgi:hypothetical protein
MTRSLRIIGLALALAALAASALASTGAFAGEEGEEGGTKDGVLSAGSYKAILDGTDAETSKFTLFTYKIECPDSTYTGEITKADSKFTIMPTYTNCVESSNKATVEMNGCGYTFTIRKTTVNKLGQYKDNYFMTTDIVCPPDKDIEIRLYASSDSEDEEICKITIKAQTLKDRAKLQNLLNVNGKTNGTLKLEHEVQNIVATKSGKCGDKETTIGRYDIGIAIKGTTEGGGENSLEVTHAP